MKPACSGCLPDPPRPDPTEQDHPEQSATLQQVGDDPAMMSRALLHGLARAPANQSPMQRVTLPAWLPRLGTRGAQLRGPDPPEMPFAPNTGLHPAAKGTKKGQDTSRHRRRPVLSGSPPRVTLRRTTLTEDMAVLEVAGAKVGTTQNALACTPYQSSGQGTLLTTTRLLGSIHAVRTSAPRGSPGATAGPTYNAPLPPQHYGRNVLPLPPKLPLCTLQNGVKHYTPTHNSSPHPPRMHHAYYRRRPLI
jgi:hypothetical protein